MPGLVPGVPDRQNATVDLIPVISTVAGAAIAFSGAIVQTAQPFRDNRHRS